MVTPKDEIITMKVLERYISKYPEDAYKWMEFIRETDDTTSYLSHRANYISLKHTPNEFVELNQLPDKATSPVDSHELGCQICKHSWKTSASMVTTTLLCGHTYHTVCIIHRMYINDDSICGVCGLDTWNIIRKILTDRDNKVKSVEQLLFNHIMKMNKSNSSIKQIKKEICNVKKAAKDLDTIAKKLNQGIIHKHIYSLNHIQIDTNIAKRKFKESRAYTNYVQCVRRYRKIEKHIFRTYNITMRDLINNQILKIPWRLRRILLYRGLPIYNTYNRIRIAPGKKVWKDPGNPGDIEGAEAINTTG
jgi:hypothetical protein